MNTLITGGFGFIGSHLIEELANQEQGNIHIVDDLSTSVLNHEQFLETLGNPDNITYDILPIADYLAETTDRYDRVYHLASIVGPAGVLPRAGVIAKSIIDDTDAVANAAADWGARVVNVSTSELYGGGISSEDDEKIISPLVSPRLEYAVGKLAAEIALVNRSKTGELDVVTARPFNVAGGRQSKAGGFVLPRFAEAAVRGDDLTVFGDGSQVRAFTHAADMARGLRLAMEQGRSGEAYNFGDRENRTTIRELACKVIKQANSTSNISLVDPKTIYGQLYEEARDKVPNMKKAQLELGWTPRKTLEQIIEDALNWERAML